MVKKNFPVVVHQLLRTVSQFPSFDQILLKQTLWTTQSLTVKVAALWAYKLKRKQLEMPVLGYSYFSNKHFVFNAINSTLPNSCTDRSVVSEFSSISLSIMLLIVTLTRTWTNLHSFFPQNGCYIVETRSMLCTRAESTWLSEYKWVAMRSCITSIERGASRRECVL